MRTDLLSEAVSPLGPVRRAVTQTSSPGVFRWSVAWARGRVFDAGGFRGGRGDEPLDPDSADDLLVGIELRRQEPDRSQARFVEVDEVAVVELIRLGGELRDGLDRAVALEGMGRFVGAEVVGVMEPDPPTRRSPPAHGTGTVIEAIHAAVEFAEVVIVVAVEVGVIDGDPDAAEVFMVVELDPGAHSVGGDVGQVDGMGSGGKEVGHDQLSPRCEELAFWGGDELVAPLDEADRSGGAVAVVFDGVHEEFAGRRHVGAGASEEVGIVGQQRGDESVPVGIGVERLLAELGHAQGFQSTLPSLDLIKDRLVRPRKHRGRGLRVPGADHVHLAAGRVHGKALERGAARRPFGTGTEHIRGIPIPDQGPAGRLREQCRFLGSIEEDAISFPPRHGEQEMPVRKSGEPDDPCLVAGVMHVDARDATGRVGI